MGVGVGVGAGVGVAVGTGVGVGVGVGIGAGAGVDGAVGVGRPGSAPPGPVTNVPVGTGVAAIGTAVGSAEVSVVLVGPPESEGCGIPEPALVTPDGTSVAPSTPPVGPNAPPMVRASIETATTRAAPTMNARKSPRCRVAASRPPRATPAAGATAYGKAQAGQTPANSIQHQRQAYTLQIEQ